MDIENRLKWTDAYFQMRQTNRAMRNARITRLTPEQISHNARQNAPARLTTRQLDPVNGQLDWPLVLRDAQYSAEREKLDQLFERRTTSSSIPLADYQDVQKYSSELLAALNKNIDQYTANDWTAARRFIQSLAYEIHFEAG